MNNQMLKADKLDAINRILVGFDSMFTNLENRYNITSPTNYPPHNLLKLTDNLYEIQLAVTGFEKDEIHVEVDNNVLTIKGNRKYKDECEYIHRGLSTKDFTRAFPLAEFIEVRNATIKNGLLIISIVRNIPEAKKPRIVDIIEVK